MSQETPLDVVLQRMRDIQMDKAAHLLAQAYTAAPQSGDLAQTLEFQISMLEMETGKGALDFFDAVNERIWKDPNDPRVRKFTGDLRTAIAEEPFLVNRYNMMVGYLITFEKECPSHLRAKLKREGNW